MENYFIELTSVENKKCLINVNQIAYIEKYADDRVKIYLNDGVLFVKATYEEIIYLL